MVLAFLQDTAAGKIGEVRFLDGSCLYPMAGQGVHVLDLIFAFNGYAPARRVFGAISGYEDLSGTHPGPKTAEFLIDFENGARAVLMAGPGAPTFEDGPDSGRPWMQKRIAVYGTHGFLHWRMDAWERSLPDGTVARGQKSYREEDLQGQANLTNALFDWLEDDTKGHPNNLGTSLDEWLTILGGYASGVSGRPIDLPFDPPEDLLDQIRHLGGEAAAEQDS
jgi:predicted dehydrogenase